MDSGEPTRQPGPCLLLDAAPTLTHVDKSAASQPDDISSAGISRPRNVWAGAMPYQEGENTFLRQSRVAERHRCENSLARPLTQRYHRHHKSTDAPGKLESACTQDAREDRHRDPRPRMLPCASRSDPGQAGGHAVVLHIDCSAATTKSSKAVGIGWTFTQFGRGAAACL
jgi:hypothetical protein